MIILYKLFKKYKNYLFKKIQMISIATDFIIKYSHIIFAEHSSLLFLFCNDIYYA